MRLSIASQPSKGGQVTHQKRLRVQPNEASNLSSTRSQSLAVSIMQTFPAPLVPDRIPSQESSLSPECIHVITTLMAHTLSSEHGKYIQKWILYHGIYDHINFGLSSWDPTDSEDIRLLQKYAESDGSVTNLPSSTVKDLINIWNYMNLLINQVGPADQKYKKLYHDIDEQLTKLTACDMQTAFGQ